MTRQIETSVGIKVAGVITAGLIAIVSTVTVLLWVGSFMNDPQPPPSFINVPFSPPLNPDSLKPSLPLDIFEVAEKGTVQDLRERLEEDGGGEGSVHMRDVQYGATLLHRAAWRNKNVDVVKYLVSSGADINTNDREYGATPLHWATENENVNIAKYLVSQGADVNVKNKNGMTPLDHAKRVGNTAVVEFISNTSTHPSTPNNSTEGSQLLPGVNTIVDTHPTVFQAPSPVPQPGLEGIWRQHIDGTATGDFSVKINNATERYEMSTIQQSSQGIKSRGITNVQYDGETWSFDSDWGYKTGKFVLKKTDNDTFEGMVDGSRNRWVRVGNEDDVKNPAAIKLRLQTELKKYAESLFTSISLDPADSDFYLFSDELRKNTNAARLTITGQGYSDLMRASKDKNWLEMINLIDRPWTPYTEFPTKETIKRVFEQLNDQRNWEIQLRLNTPKKLIQEGKKIVPVSFYNFTDFSKVFRFDEVSAGGDVYVDTICFATIENKKWQEKDFGYSADWSYWKGKRCFLLLNVKQQDAFRSQFQIWNELLKKEIESRQIAIKDDKLKPEIAFKKMRILYDSTLTEALEWCKNDSKTVKSKVQAHIDTKTQIPIDTKVQTLTDTIKEKERRLKLIELDIQLEETPDPKKRELRGQRNQLREEIKSLKEML